MKLREIVLKSTVSSKRKAIEKCINKSVFFIDSNQDILIGPVEVRLYEDNTYEAVDRLNNNAKTGYYCRDLKQLFCVVNY